MHALYSPSRQRRARWGLVIPVGMVGVAIVMLGVTALSVESLMMGGVTAGFVVVLAVLLLIMNATVFIRAEIRPDRLVLVLFPPVRRSVPWADVRGVEYDEFHHHCGPVLRLRSGRRWTVRCLRTTTAHRDEARANTGALREALDVWQRTGDATRGPGKPGEAAGPGR